MGKVVINPILVGVLSVGITNSKIDRTPICFDYTREIQYVGKNDKGRERLPKENR